MLVLSEENCTDKHSHLLNMMPQNRNRTQRLLPFGMGIHAQPGVIRGARAVTGSPENNYFHHLFMLSEVRAAALRNHPFSLREIHTVNSAANTTVIYKYFCRI